MDATAHTTCSSTTCSDSQRVFLELTLSTVADAMSSLRVAYYYLWGKLSNIEGTRSYNCYWFMTCNSRSFVVALYDCCTIGNKMLNNIQCKQK